MSWRILKTSSQRSQHTALQNFTKPLEVTLTSLSSRGLCRACCGRGFFSWQSSFVRSNVLRGDGRACASEFVARGYSTYNRCTYNLNDSTGKLYSVNPNDLNIFARLHWIATQLWRMLCGYISLSILALLVLQYSAQASSAGKQGVVSSLIIHIQALK